LRIDEPGDLMRVLERGRRAHEHYRGPTEHVIYSYNR
jgi:hypothetical protein